jgi:hypothetical protein
MAYYDKSKVYAPSQTVQQGAMSAQAAPVSNIPPQYQGIPQTGLIGSEQALLQGYGNALGALDQGMGMARGDINTALQGGMSSLKGGLQRGNQAFSAGAGAIRNAQGQIDDLYGQGINAGNQYYGQGLQAGNQAYNQAVDPLMGYVPGGQNAFNRQAALSGAMGADAQARAMQNWQEGPEQAFLREQGERSVTRNAAALGGLGSGNVMKELNRFGTGLAAQDFQNSFNRLGNVSGQGLQAAGQVGALRGAQGQMNANMLGQQGQMNANMRGQQAGLQGNMSQALAGLMGQKAQFGGNMANSMASLQQQAGSQLGNMGFQGGMAAGQWGMSTGNNLAIGRTNAGNAIANNLAGTTAGLATLADQQGRGLSDITGQQGQNLATMLQNAGLTQSQIQQIMAQGLAGANTAAGSQAAGLPGIPGIQQTDGMLGQIGNFATGIGTLLASDKRLKANIQKVGETAGGTNLYTWDWNATGRAIAGDQPTYGVIAQEVPDAAVMGADGFLRVDYARVK